ncbi:MAG: hypothetical protein ACM3H9_00625 [Rhodospirillaceae bacterium]|jgi:hypothetical protein
MMDREGARRRVGFALLLSAFGIAGLAALMFSAAIPVTAGPRFLVSGALVVAAIVDAFVAIVLINQHAG